MRFGGASDGKATPLRGYTAKIGGGKYASSPDFKSDRGDGPEGPSRRAYHKDSMRSLGRGRGRGRG